jgi:hypothetical protein
MAFRKTHGLQSPGYIVCWIRVARILGEDKQLPSGYTQILARELLWVLLVEPPHWAGSVVEGLRQLAARRLTQAVIPT